MIVKSLYQCKQCGPKTSKEVVCRFGKECEIVCKQCLQVIETCSKQSNRTSQK